MVFPRLSRSLLRTWGDRWYREAPLPLRDFDSYAAYDPDTSGLADIIVLTRRLPAAVNAYATTNINGVVTSVDGKPVTSMVQLAKALEHGKGDYIVIGFLGSDDPVVLSRAAVKESNASINRKYGVTTDRWLQGPEADGAIRWEAKP